MKKLSTPADIEARINKHWTRREKMRFTFEEMIIVLRQLRGVEKEAVELRRQNDIMGRLDALERDVECLKSIPE